MTADLGIRALTRVEDPFTLRSARQMQAFREHVARLPLAGIASAIGPPFIVATVRVVRLLVAIARAAAQVRMSILALVIARILGVITWVVAPSV
jgi:hypothetical protein